MLLDAAIMRQHRRFDANIGRKANLVTE